MFSGDSKLLVGVIGARVSVSVRERETGYLLTVHLHFKKAPPARIN